MTLAHRQIAFVLGFVLVFGAAMNLLVLQAKRRTPPASSALAGTERIPSGRSDGPGPATGTPALQEAQRAPAVGDVAAAATGSAPAVTGTVSAADGSVEVTRGIQRELNARGYEAGSPDGVAGIVTRAAILAYENDFGLPLTARANEELLSRIVLGSATAAGSAAGSSTALTPEAQGVVVSVKQALAGLGRDVGPIDGVITPRLRQTIRQFEISQRLPESGRISAPLVSRLMRLKGSAGGAAGTGAAGSGASVPRVTQARSAGKVAPAR